MTIDEYRYYLKVERGMSLNTVASYCSDVKAFLEETGKDGRTAQPSDIVGYISSKDMSKRSQARILSSLRSFFNWLILEK
ncbi:MAG: site-specific integrase, partial [Bacteroidales bacterium]|nr:site-specific integrase [Bacteroidales bacterium]